MEAEKQQKRGLLKDSSFYLLATIITTAISFLTLPIYTRYLSPQDFGIVALFFTFGSVTAGLLSIGIKTASYRYYFQYKENLQDFKVLNTSNLLFLLVCFMVSGIGIYHLANWFSTILFDGKMTADIIRWSFLSGSMGYLLIYLSLLLTAQSRAITYSAITILQVILNNGFSFYFIFAHSLTYLAKIYGLILTQIVMLACLLFFTRNLFGFQFSLSSLKKSIRFSYPLIPRQTIGLIYSSFDRVMLNQYNGLTSVAYYTFGAKFANLLKMIFDSISKAWTPFIMEKLHENTEEARQHIVIRYFKIAFLLTCVGLGIIYFSEEVIKLLVTKEFYPSMFVVPVYVYLHLFLIINMIAMNQIMFSEKMFVLLPSSIVGITVNILLNILLIPKYGPIGAAIATSLAALCGNSIMLYYGFRVCPLPVSKRKLAGIFLITIAFTLPVYPIMVLDINLFVKLILKTTIIIVYVGSGIFLNYISIKDIKQVVSSVMEIVSYRILYHKLSFILKK
jgi:O-antigen/teichoic acid export membrane protein